MKDVNKINDTNKIELSKDLLNLTEILAKNVHDLWALERIKDGWTFGVERDDKKKEHPCLIPYEQLSENEKKYDRNTAIQTLKVIISNGYKIHKSK